VDGLFNGIRIRDLFSLDSEDGKYKFDLINLTDNLRIGGILGYKYDEYDGVWRDEEGNEVKGIMKVLSSVDITTIYRAIVEEGTISEKIQGIVAGFGNFSIGDVFETLGYEKAEDGKWYKDGEPLQSELLNVLLDIMLKDIVGTGDITPLGVLRNLLNAVEDVAEGLSIGEGLGEFFGIEVDEDGNFVYTDSERGDVNFALKSILGVNIDDIIAVFNKDQLDIKEILGVFRESVSGVRIGDILGYNEIGGKWINADGNEVNPILALLANVDLAGIYEVVDFSGSVTDIVKAFVSELTLGDVASSLLDMTVTGEKPNLEYTLHFGDREIVLSPAIDRVLNLAIWQIISGFDENDDYDLLKEVYDITVGDMFNFRYDEEKGLWGIDFGDGEVHYVTGAFGKVLSYKVGELLDPDEPFTPQHFLQDLMTLSIGEVAQAVFGYTPTEDGFENVRGGETNPFIETLCKIGLTFTEISDAIQGKAEIYVYVELYEVFNGVKVGDYVSVFTDIDKNENGRYVGEGPFGVLFTILYNIDIGSVVDAVFKVINNEELDYRELLAELLEDVDDMFIGEILTFHYDDEIGVWYVDLGEGEKFYLPGAANKVLSYRLNEVFEPENDYKPDSFVEDMLEVDVGSVMQSVFGYHMTNEGYVNLNGDGLDPFMETLCRVGLTIGEIVDYIKGEGEIDARIELREVFDGLKVGFYVSAFTDVELKDGRYVVEGPLGVLLGIVYNIDIGKVIVDNIFKVIEGEKIVPLEVAEDVFGDSTFGDIIAPILDAEKDGEGRYSKDGKLFGNAIDGLFAVKVADLIDEMLGDKATTESRVDYIKEIALDYMVGDYLVYFTNFVYDEEAECWKKDDGSEIYPPLAKLLKVNVKEVIDKMTDENSSVDDKISYILSLFDGLMVGDLFGLFVGLEYDNESGYWTQDGERKGEALNAALSVYVTDFVNAVRGGIDEVHEILQDDFGALKVGNIVQIINANLTESGDKWLDGGEEVSDIIEALYDVKVGDILLAVYTIIDNEKGLAYENSGERKLGYYFGDFYNALLEESTLTLDGEDYKADGNFAALAEKIFNVKVNDIKKGIDEDPVEFLKDLVYDFTLRDIAFDALRMALGEDGAVSFKGYAEEDIPVEGKLAKLVNCALAVSVREVAEAVENGNIVDFVIDTFGSVAVGDFAQIAMDISETDDKDWIDGENAPVKRIMNALFKVNVAQVYGYVKNEEGLEVTDLIVKVLKDVLGDNNVNYYLDDLIEDEEAITNKEIFKKSIGNIVLYKLVGDILAVDEINDIYNILKDVLGE
ncbi:MAG: hypothetical protein J6N93_08045, partial [Clostridia bacterium]|nr:hypothetical protein [Clostridia bacterium]